MNRVMKKYKLLLVGLLYINFIIYASDMPQHPDKDPSSFSKDDLTLTQIPADLEENSHGIINKPKLKKEVLRIVTDAETVVNTILNKKQSPKNTHGKKVQKETKRILGQIKNIFH